MSRQDIQRAIVSRVITTPGTRLDVNQIRVDGTTLNIFAVMMSACADLLDANGSARIAANLSATARDVDLDTLVTEQTFGRFERKSAAASSLSAFVNRVSPATGDGLIPAGTEILVGALTFTVDYDVQFLAGQTGKLPISATCTKLGTSTNVALAGLRFKSPSALFDPAIVLSTTNGAGVTPPSGDWATGGANKETDSDFRARRALFDAGLDRNIDLISAGAKNVPGVVFATTIEELDGNSQPTGRVFLYVGDVNGRANDALVARVRAALRKFRLCGQNVLIVGSVPSLQTIKLSIGVLDGYTQSDVQARVKSAVISTVNALAPGATLARASIAAAVQSVSGAVLLASAPFGCTVPSADVVAASSATIFRTSPELVSYA